MFAYKLVFKNYNFFCKVYKKNIINVNNIYLNFVFFYSLSKANVSLVYFLYIINYILKGLSLTCFSFFLIKKAPACLNFF